MQLRHPFLFAAAALLFFTTLIPPFYGLFSYAHIFIVTMTCMYLGNMIRLYRQNPIQKLIFWIIGTITVVIFYNPVISPASEYWSAWPLVHLLSSAFMLVAAFISPEAIKKESANPISEEN
ncbi:hypothetical protein [Spirosoma harenae]